MWKVLCSIYRRLWGFLYGPDILFSISSSSQPSVNVPDFTITSSLIKVLLYLQTRSIYCFLQSRFLAAGLACLMIHKDLPMLAYILTGTPISGRFAQRKMNKKQTSSPQALFDFGRGAETCLVKHKLFEIPNRNLGYVDIYQ